MISFTLFRPGFWQDLIVDPFQNIAPTHLVKTLDTLPAGNVIRMRMAGEDAIGKHREFSVLFTVPKGDTGQQKLTNIGIETYQSQGKTLIDMVTFGSPAAKEQLQFDQQILDIRVPVKRWRKEWLWLPAILLFGIIIQNQRRRLLSAPVTKTPQKSAIV